MAHLEKRNENHPQVLSNIERAIHKGRRRRRKTGARRVLIDKLHPVVRHGPALEDGDQDAPNSQHGIEGDAGPEQTARPEAGAHARKDGQVKGQQRELDEGNVDEVQYFEDVKVHGEDGHFLRRHGPGISSEAMLYEAYLVDDGAGQTDDQCGQDDPVVGAAAAAGAEPSFEDETGQCDEGGDEAQGEVDG